MSALNLERTRAVVKPFKPPEKQRVFNESVVNVFYYNEDNVEETNRCSNETCVEYLLRPGITWINTANLSQNHIEELSTTAKLHPLLQEDILSYGQRPKMDEINNRLFVLMNMLYFNDETGIIEQEQISLALGKNFVISFQEDSLRDVFDPVRRKLRLAQSKLRITNADYLFYSLIDIIVDSYFIVIEKLGEQIEAAEEKILHRNNTAVFSQLNQLRKDIILLKRNTLPVRDLVAALIRSESDLLEDATTKYFKDVYDHIVQANDLTENYREIIMGLQDLYMNNVNLRMNEVMKTLAIITAIMAPATVIGGIFGMNFKYIPFQDHPYGFVGTVVVMMTIPIVMIYWFYRRKWFQRDLPAVPD